MKEIKATTVYINLEGGFWGLKSDNDYLPLNFPEQLKTDGVQTTCVIEVLADVQTAFNWGIPCRIISFQTLNPYK